MSSCTPPICRSTPAARAPDSAPGTRSRSRWSSKPRSTSAGSPCTCARRPPWTGWAATDSGCSCSCRPGSSLPRPEDPRPPASPCSAAPPSCSGSSSHGLHGWTATARSAPDRCFFSPFPFLSFYSLLFYATARSAPDRCFFLSFPLSVLLLSAFLPPRRHGLLIGERLGRERLTPVHVRRDTGVVERERVRRPRNDGSA